MTESDQTGSVPGWPPAHAAQVGIAVVGPNPAMDRTEEIEHFRPHQVNRALVSSPRAGGKSFIVARALRRLGRDVTLYGFLGGPTGQYLRAECAKLGIRDRHTTIEGETRINTVLVDRHAGLATVINEPGPEISASEAETLGEALNEDLVAGDILVLSGSLPRGVSKDLYAGLITSVRERGVRAIVDAEGEVLARAVAVGPWAVKCNLQEFRTIAPDAPDEVTSDAARQELFDCMRVVVSAGVQLVIVTLGASGLLAVSRTEAFEVTAAPVVAKNPTGSGDTFLAAFVAACSNSSPLDQALQFGAAAASANAAVLVPDIGPSPQLDSLIARTRVIRHELDFADVVVAGNDR